MRLDARDLAKAVEGSVEDGTVSVVEPRGEDVRLRVERTSSEHGVQAAVSTEIFFRFAEKVVVGLTTTTSFVEPKMSPVSDSTARKTKEGETLSDLIAFVMSEERKFVKRESAEALRKSDEFRDAR